MIPFQNGLDPTSASHLSNVSEILYGIAQNNNTMKSARHILYTVYMLKIYSYTHNTVEVKMLCMQSDVSVLQKLGRKTKKGRGRVFWVSSSSNERPLNNESLIMSVLIIKRELSGTKQLKSHYQTSLQKEGREERRLTVYLYVT